MSWECGQNGGKKKGVENFRRETSRKQPLYSQEGFKIWFDLTEIGYEDGRYMFCTKVGFGVRDVNNTF
jgi:hypothetical protein